MTPMIWPICCDDLAMALIASTAWRTTAALFLASSSAVAATSRACCVPSADFFTAAVTSVSVAVVCFEAGGLLLGAVRQIVGRRRHFLRARLDRAGGVDDADDASP